MILTGKALCSSLSSGGKTGEERRAVPYTSVHDCWWWDSWSHHQQP